MLASGRLGNGGAVIWLGVAALLTGLSLVMHASVIRHLTSAIPSDAGDPLLNTWILWWNAQRVPLTDAYWNAPAFAPEPNMFALSETLLGLTWLTTPLQWLGASPLVAYNTAFILAPILNGLAAFWLCLTLTNRHDAALIGALALAFAPYQADHLSHLQIRAIFFAPIALAALHRYWSTGAWRWLGVFTIAVVLNGLVSGYFLLYFSILFGIAIAWLAVASGERRRLAGVITAIAVAALLLAPVILKYREVHRDLDLHRSINEIELFSADVRSFALGSTRLAAWPESTPQFPEQASYPGLAIAALIAAGAAAAFRDRRPLAPISWRRSLLVRALSVLSVTVLCAGVVVMLMGGVSYKVTGIAIDLAILAVLASAGFAGLVRSGSPAGLYATGAVVAAMFALGPVGRVFGHRFWYKPPFAWLLTAPGFESARVPARFSFVVMVCLSVLAALAVRRLWPSVTRASLMMTGVIGIVIVADGWTTIPVVPVPEPMPVRVDADLVVELPAPSLMEDVAAMYRGMAHRRPVVNGYSGWRPPHYAALERDLRKDCLGSLDTLRGGRSMDAVIWRHTSNAAAIDAQLRELWADAVREEHAKVIVYRQPRSAGRPAAVTRCPPSLAPGG
jgi:hypothetical protein